MVREVERQFGRVDFVNEVIKNLCCEYSDDLKYYDPKTGQTILIIDKQYFKDLFVRARDLDFCCTHASCLHKEKHLVRFEKASEDNLEQSADWWKHVK